MNISEDLHFDTHLYTRLHDYGTCGQPLIIRELLSSSSANCSSKHARGWILYWTSTLFYPCVFLFFFSSQETLRLNAQFCFCFLSWNVSRFTAGSNPFSPVVHGCTSFFSTLIRWWASVESQGWRIQQRWPTTSSTMAFLYRVHRLPKSWTQWILRPWRSPWATLSSCKQSVSTASSWHLTTRQIDRNTHRHAKQNTWLMLSWERKARAGLRGIEEKSWGISLLLKVSEMLSAGHCLFGLKGCWLLRGREREREKGWDRVCGKRKGAGGMQHSLTDCCLQ